LYHKTPKTTKLRKAQIKEKLEQNKINSDGLKKDIWKRACEENCIPNTKKPDVENVSKSILDALNEVAYYDDSQIVSLSVEKFRSVNPRAEVFIEEYKKMG